ncbi:uncharacterized protein LOC134674140 [Cydia fagiglandana]|uniref:uncharacterized protein LOC134674140 n=1 Tax=Cydia fagiglandana TaxID=1458189 RepID=UPI002FEE3F13
MKKDEVKKKIEINRRIQNEYLMNNILDKDFQAMLFPLSFFQSTGLRCFIIISNFKNIMVMVTLCIACENFYRATNLAESCCAQNLSNAIPKGMRQTCKNVLRLNRATLRKMSAYGVFEVDAAFPLRLLSIIVTYVVVLLQFAFLT